MEEADGAGKVIVVVDDVGEVRHGFATFVSWDREGIRIVERLLRGVYDIYRSLPAVCFVRRRGWYMG